jgi:hypothetical protein
VTESGSPRSATMNGTIVLIMNRGILTAANRQRAGVSDQARASERDTATGEDVHDVHDIT